MSRALRAGLGWAALAVVVVLVALTVWAAGRDSTVGDHLRNPDDRSPVGSLALAEVLRAQGVDVQVTRSFWETEDAVSLYSDTTVLVDDDWWVLTPEAYGELAHIADHFLLVLPNDDALAALAPGVEYAGFTGGELSASCELPAAARAERIEAAGDAYRVDADAVGCFPNEAGDGYSLVRADYETREVTVLGAADLLRNDTITGSGNAALALGLLGERRHLVWYQPDFDDYSWEPEGSLASRQADWFAPLVVLVLLVGVAAAVWRGRRMGPVVVEDLPVEVRSSETMDGRARLYERGGSRNHALGTLRSATVARLARTLGLARTATLDEVIATTAATTGRDPNVVDALLRSATASDDRSLVRLSDELLRLERDVARDVTPR
ncbi:DUF4350 domain-containing protein [Protaetiibacter intestinalis]|uniref:DUF4350 domain-containing protein n=1 Tax=Protaetiibacter intestinalis TaxID=2419774 RepID=A0A387B0Y8_9MICO|nr:DUF4350 domain-containing protein [Protaetiibacter intestinalis]AYF97164.1 DUF4350 domain-containing protein [Protaetiibacter intestinalis]